MVQHYEEQEDDASRLLGFTVEIVTAHLSHNSVALGDVPGFIGNVHDKLKELVEGETEPVEVKPTPIVPVRQSIKPDYLVCLVCGKRSQILKSHLRGSHGLTPEQYRDAYDLPREYPMTAPNTTEAYRQRAIKLNLGDKLRQGRNAERVATGKPPLKAVGKK